MKAVCPVCDRLVTIIPGAWKAEYRQRWYWPVRHQDEAGRDCSGSERAL